MNYDPLGRLVKQTDPDGHDTAFTRDSDGNITQLRDRAGKLTTYTYNRFGDVEMSAPAARQSSKSTTTRTAMR